VADSDLPAFYAAVMALRKEIARDYLRLVLFTGMRRRETARLRWQDVDFRDGVIKVPAFSTKSGRPLDLPMSDYVRDLLVARRSIGDARYVFPAVSKSGHLEDPQFALREVEQISGVGSRFMIFAELSCRSQRAATCLPTF